MIGNLLHHRRINSNATVSKAGSKSNAPPKINAFREFPTERETDETPGKSVFLQAQRDCVLQPGVARPELPWVAVRVVLNPAGVATLFLRRGRNPVGVVGLGRAFPR